MNIQTLTDTQRARLALLVMYAWDMCDQAMEPTSTTLDPRIRADGWGVVGIITGAYNIAVSGTTIRQQFMRAGASLKRYGYLAVNSADPTQYVAVIRGTDGAEEWADDFDFVAANRPPFAGRVETGFVDIYQSMQYVPLEPPAAPRPLADALSAAVPAGASVTVLGHSLGSSLGTLLAYDLADPARLGALRTGALLFASPKTGDHDFVAAFAALLDNYQVINYEDDVVPDVPPFDIFHMDLYRPLPRCRILAEANSSPKINNADKACCHHLICYVAELDLTVFQNATQAAGWMGDDANCAKCVS